MKVCHKRLQKEYLALKRQPVDNIQAVPNDRNILEWHYVVFGPEDSVYQGGVYHGKLIFSEDYPYKPPSIIMLTKSGRFKTNTRLCLSMSDFHPETWNPLWSVGSILSGLLSFMLDKAPTLGSVETSDRRKRELAKLSMQENMRNEQFCRFFPEIVEKHKRRNKQIGNIALHKPPLEYESSNNPGENLHTLGVDENERVQDVKSSISCRAVTIALAILAFALVLPLKL